MRWFTFSLALVGWSASAGACPLCYSALAGTSLATRLAYYLSTLAMILLPPLLLTILFFWIRREGRKNPL